MEFTRKELGILQGVLIVEQYELTDMLGLQTNHFDIKSMYEYIKIIEGMLERVNAEIEKYDANEKKAVKKSFKQE